MEVNRANFAAVVDEFCELAQSCDFFAFDEEMTGINIAGVEENPLASLQDRYHAKKLVAERYSIIQIGICLFHRSEENPLHYIARPFNFFLFPTSIEESGFSPQSNSSRSDVVLSSSAIAFLRKHNMDFQRWVYQGVPFCNEPIECLIRKQYEDAESLRTSGPKFQKDFLTTNDSLWLESSMAAAKRFSEASDGPSELMMIPNKNRAAQNLFRHEVERNFANLLVAFRRRGQAKDVVLQRVTSEERKRKESTDKALREQDLLDKIGFRRAFRALVNCKKPCVGHNSLADILFLLSALDRPLPERVVDFRQRLRELFPVVFDTKFISSDISAFPAGRFSSTHLGGLYEAYHTSSESVRISLPLGFQAYNPKTLVSGQSNKQGRNHAAHEAGFDALMTGTVLIHLLKEANVTFEEASQRYGNKVSVFRSIYAFDGNASDCEYSLARGPVLVATHNISLTHSDVETLVGAACDPNESDVKDVLPPTSAFSIMALDASSTAVVPMFAEVTQEQVILLQKRLQIKAQSSSLTESVKFEIHRRPMSAIFDETATAKPPQPESNAAITPRLCGIFGVHPKEFLRSSVGKILRRGR